MAITLNGFEQGTSGNALAAAGSGGGADTAFDTVTTSGAGAAATYDNAHAKRGSLSGKFVTAGAAGSTSFVAWTTTVGTQTTVYVRAYFWVSANPPAIAMIMRVVNGSNLCAGVNITTGGLLQIRDANNTSIATMTGAVPTGQWVRVEFKVVCSATVGTAEVRLYNSADSTTATETISGTALNTNTQATGYRVGAATTGTAGSLTAWIDDFGVSTTDWLGPSTVAATSTASLTLSASGTATAPGGAATGTAALDLTAAGTAQAPTVGTAALSLSASGTAQAPDVGSAALDLSATGAAQAPVTATAALTLSGTSAAQAPATGSGALSLTAAGTAQAPATGAAAVDLTATGAAQAPVSAAAVLALAAAGTVQAQAGAIALLDLTAAGTLQALATATAVLTLDALLTVPALAVFLEPSETWTQSQTWLGKPSLQAFTDNRRWTQVQTWEIHVDVAPPVVPLPVIIPAVDVMRQSYVYPAPTLDDHGWPVDWQPTSRTIEKWANYVQVVIDYKSITFPRSIPAIVESWSTTSPYTWGVATVRFPQFTGFDNHSANGFDEGNECRLFKVNPDNSRGKLLFQGLVASVEDRSGGVGITVEMQGWLNSALLAVCQPNLGTVRPRDLATVIGETLDGTPSRRFGVTYRNPTGILDQTRGSLDQTRLDFVTGRLALAVSDDGAASYTVVMAGSRPSVVPKDKTTVAYTVRYGQPGITVDLSKDATQTPNVIYGSGVDPESRFWRNTKYPLAHPDDSLPYPFTDAGDVITTGTSDSDTSSGRGVSDWQRRVNYLNVSHDVVVDGVYSAADEAACRSVQSHFGILVDGIVGPQTWDATFGVGSNIGDLNSAYVAPLAYIPAVEKHTYYASGAVRGDNPAYDNSVLRVETYVEFGENITKADGIRLAKAQLARDYPPGWVGSVTFNADPNQCHRREIVADKVILLEGFQGTNVKLYIAEAVVDNLSGSVTCRVSEKALDLPSLAAVYQRDRDAKTDPAKQAFDQLRRSRLTDDTSVQWDSEDICGVIPRAALYHGLWSVLRIPFAQVADLAQTILTTSSPATPFAVGVFGKPVNAADLVRYVGNPLAQSSPWDTHADTLNDKYGLWMSWGSQDQPCGYYPSDFSSDSPTLTGRMKDTAGFHFASSNPPWAWVALYASSSCFIEGRFEFSVPS